MAHSRVLHCVVAYLDEPCGQSPERPTARDGSPRPAVRTSEHEYQPHTAHKRKQAGISLPATRGIGSKPISRVYS